jgi:hypothetical protein
MVLSILKDGQINLKYISVAVNEFKILNLLARIPVLNLFYYNYILLFHAFQCFIVIYQMIIF